MSCSARTPRRGWFVWLFDDLRQALPDTAEILEIGCGRGQPWQANAARVPTTWRLTLSDLSPGMVARARATLAGQVQADFEVLDVQAIPYADASYDAIIANHMLYHAPDRQRALREIRRVLRPGGRLFAATNGHDHPWELRELVATHLPGRGGYLSGDASFGLEGGVSQLEAVFNEVIRDRYPDSLEVTDPEPLLGYVRSLRAGSRVDESQLAALRQVVASAIAADGAFHISKSPGLLIAS